MLTTSLFQLQLILTEYHEKFQGPEKLEVYALLFKKFVRQHSVFIHGILVLMYTHFLLPRYIM